MWHSDLHRQSRKAERDVVRKMRCSFGMLRLYARIEFFRNPNFCRPWTSRRPRNRLEWRARTSTPQRNMLSSRNTPVALTLIRLNSCVALDAFPFMSLGLNPSLIYRLEPPSSDSTFSGYLRISTVL